jgi:hypothetical protein
MATAGPHFGRSTKAGGEVISLTRQIIPDSLRQRRPAVSYSGLDGVKSLAADGFSIGTVYPFPDRRREPAAKVAA